jgi:hypothetical protein
MKILPPRADQPRVAGWIFMFTWLLGGVALVIGLEDDGTVEAVCALLMLLVACGLWLWAVKLSRGKGEGGLVVIAFWLICLAIAVLSDFRHYIKDVFVWVSTGIICCLIVAFVTSYRQTNYNAVAE